MPRRAFIQHPPDTEMTRRRTFSNSSRCSLDSVSSMDTSTSMTASARSPRHHADAFAPPSTLRSQRLLMVGFGCVGMVLFCINTSISQQHLLRLQEQGTLLRLGFQDRGSGSSEHTGVDSGATERALRTRVAELEQVLQEDEAESQRQDPQDDVKYLVEEESRLELELTEAQRKVKSLQQQVRSLGGTVDDAVPAAVSDTLPLETSKRNTTGKFAYAYFIGGVDPENESYRGYIYDVLVNAHTIQSEDSQSDTVLWVQMAAKSTTETLPADDRRMLDAYGVQVRYLPRNIKDSFHDLMMHKFRVLQMTAYDRVLYVDGDIMLLTNLDYLFQLSMDSVLKENMIINGYQEPANGGLFMLAPQPGDWDRLNEIMRKTAERGKTLPYPRFDVVQGWGHEIIPPDSYDLINGRKNLTKWDFYGAFSDQGLLFHWTKYEKKSVSVVFRKEVNNWGPGTEPDSLQLESVTTLAELTRRANLPSRWCFKGQARFRLCEFVIRDYYHFTGKHKPWRIGPKKDKNSPFHIWFRTLRAVHDKIHINNVDFNNWSYKHRSPLGYYPLEKDMADNVKRNNAVTTAAA